jgi:hypothetical protein
MLLLGRFKHSKAFNRQTPKLEEMRVQFVMRAAALE